jgi:hypothetical protein
MPAGAIIEKQDRYVYIIEHVEKLLKEMEASETYAEPTGV